MVIGCRLRASSRAPTGGNNSCSSHCMTPQELRDRTDRFSVDIITFCRSLLPADSLTLRLIGQLQDAGTSMASNDHAACRAQSRAHFVAKLSIAVEEADECVLSLPRNRQRWPNHPTAQSSINRQSTIDNGITQSSLTNSRNSQSIDNR